MLVLYAGGTRIFATNLNTQTFAYQQFDQTQVDPNRAKQLRNARSGRLEENFQPERWLHWHHTQNLFDSTI
jgi:hypothetical protein